MEFVAVTDAARRLGVTTRQVQYRAELVSGTRGRAQVYRYHGHSRAAERLRRELVDTSGAATVLGLIEAPDGVDGYVTAQDLNKVVARHALIEDAGAQHSISLNLLTSGSARPA